MIKLLSKSSNVLPLIKNMSFFMANSDEYYKILGVPKNASTQQIKSAFRQKALKEHPDKGGDPQKFKKIAQAYETLSKPQKRKLYDSGQDYRGMGGEPDMEDIFNMFHRDNYTRNQMQAQKNIQIKLTLSEIYRGVSKRIKYEIDKSCIKCKGKGANLTVECKECFGKGTISKKAQIAPGLYHNSIRDCPQCKGQGFTYKERDKCHECDGEKTIKTQKQKQIAVEPGCPENTTFQFPGEGNQYPKLKTGQLIVNVVIEEHPVLKRIGADLYMKKTIPLVEALTGFSVELEHLDGKVYKIQTQPGEIISHESKKMIKGMGMPFYKNHNKYGNLIIEFQIKYPERNCFNEEDISKLKQILSKDKQSQEQKQNQHKSKELNQIRKILQSMTENDLNPNPKGGKQKQEKQGVRCGTQ